MEKRKTDTDTAAGAILDLVHSLKRQSVLLAVDGRCGSGKTTLAEALRRKAGAQVVHMDDFYLRPQQRTPARYAEPGGNVDRERVLKEVLIPLHAGRRTVYRPYDAHRQTMFEPVPLSPAPITVIEGSYSCHPALWDYYDLRVFLDVAPEEQLRRIEARNGPEMLAMFKDRWIPLEEGYFREFAPDKKCDCCFELNW